MTIQDRDPGTLDSRFDLERIVEDPDGQGGMTVSWELVARVWGSLTLRVQRSTELAQQIEEINLHQIIIRFREDVSSGWRFQKDNRIFLIKMVQNEGEKGRYLICETQEQGR